MNFMIKLSQDSSMHLKTISIFSLLALTICTQASAAQLLELRNHQNGILQSFISQPQLNNIVSETTLKETGKYVDSHHATHIRVQELYRGYPVWNARAVIHTPNVNSINHSFTDLFSQPQAQQSMNGELYQHLELDLAKTPNIIFNKQQANRALQFVVNKYKEKIPYSKNLQINNAKSQLMVFVDKQQTAHWVFYITFSAPAGKIGDLPAKPVYMIDAVNFMIYQTWDDIKTDYVSGGGFGGNPHSGKLNYDGLPNDLASFTVKREANECYLETDEIVVNSIKINEVMHYPCAQPDSQHNHVYWDGSFDTINGGYSPANDAMFAAQVLKRFYKEWYNVPVLVNPDGSNMRLVMNVHYSKLDNAFWDGATMTFGDGIELYPLTSLTIAAHEVSHGFTQQHSDLTYTGQSGAMNEAFSDMAAQTAEFYGYGKSSWLIGSDIIKLDGESMRYMDQPSKDCFGKEPGTFCSIDRADQYYDGLDVHYGSGVYNRAFYLLSTTPDWNPRKAFAVMLHANASYWLAQTQYADGAACVIKAAADLGYDKHAVEQAFKAVGLSVNQSCTNKDS